MLAVILALLVPVTGSGAASPGDSDARAVAAEPTGGQGYWLAGGDGSVYEFGEATPFGGATRPNKPIAGMAPTPSGRGYWLVGSGGGVFAFGDARFLGSTGHLSLNRPVVGMAASPTGAGYWFVAADGGIFAFGDAGFYGSTGAMRLNRPIVAMAATPTGAGYWLVASDGGVFAFGDARFYGSTGNLRLNAPIVGAARTSSGRGYWFTAADGGVFNFGDAAFVGSTGGRALPHPVIGMAGVPSGATQPNAGPSPAHPPTPPAPGGDPARPDAPSDTPPDAVAPGPPAPVPAPGPGTVPGAPFDVGLVGDTGYTESQERSFLKVRTHMNGLPLAFSIHIGDIWAEGEACTEANYQHVRDVFDGFAHPLVYTPGDNEWADCPQGSSSSLNRVRRLFFPADETLGQRRLIVTRQYPTFVENARWTQGGVVFVTINEPGATGRGGSHRDTNIAWLDEAFDEAEATGAPGVVVAWQDNPFEPSGGRLAKVLRARTISFGRPVVLVHGDTHNYRIDHPWSDARNFTRVEVHGDTSSAQWVRMTVDPGSPTVFGFDNERAG